MWVLIIIVAFVLGWIIGVEVYKYDLRNSPVILPPKNKYDVHRELWDFHKQEYDVRLKEWERQNAELEKQRKEFYEQNPDFPIKTMYMQVTAPPQKISFNEI